MDVIGNTNCGIYKITSPSGRIYIGQSVNIKERFREHAKTHRGKAQTKLKNSFSKYGVENHQFDIIEYCSREELNCSERFWQDEFDVTSKNGLNCILQECGEQRRTVSEETIKKLNRKGDKNPMYGKKGKDNPNFGRKASEETRLLMSKLMMGRYKGVKSSNSKLILDNQTGIFYFGAVEAAEAMNLKESNMRDMLRGTYKNKTSLRYV